MDLDDLSLSSIEDEQCNKGTSSMKSERGNEGIHLPISIDKNSTQSNNQRLQKYAETGYSAKVTKRSRSKVQNEILKVQEGGSSVCTIGKDSTSNTSSMVGNEILKTSQSMLSFTSTDATCGSSSSNSISSEDELLDYLEEISKRCETEDVSDLEQPILGLPRRAVDNVSTPPSTASFSGIDLGNESQTTDCAFIVADRSSLPEDSNSLKSPDMCNSPDAVDLPSLPKGRLSNHFKSDEFPSKICFSSTLASDASDTEELSSNKNTITVPPLLGKALSLNIREDETSVIPDSGAIGGFHDSDCNPQNYCQKEDKSVRRKVKTGPPTSSYSLPNRSSAPSASSSPRKVGRSLLQISKSLEKTSHKEDDWDINETYSRRGEMEHFKPNSWAQELISFCYRTQNADTTPRLDTESILEEVHHFFQRNHVEADENLSWKQNKYRILTSKYFSDEFSRSHGLLCNEELMKERLKDLECYTSLYLRKQRELLELCITLMECSVSEETFIDYFKTRILGVECDIFYPSIRERRNDSVINRRLFSIEKGIDFHVMLELYKKLTTEGASFRSMLHESEMPSAAEERFRCRELLSVSENSSQVPCEFSAGNQSAIYTDFQPLNPTLSQNESGNIDSPSSNEANMPQNEEFPAESFQTESKDDSNALDSSVTGGNEQIPLSTTRAKEMLDSSIEQSAGENGSSVSAADLDSKVDRAMASEF